MRIERKKMFRKKLKQRIKNCIDHDIKQGHLDNLPLNASNLKKALGKSVDIVVRQVGIGRDTKLWATLIYIDGLVNLNQISNYILKPLDQNEVFEGIKNEQEVIPLIMKGAIYFATVELYNNTQKAVQSVLSGHALLIFDTQEKAIAFETKGYEKRSITSSTEESSYKGSKVAFVEDLRLNTACMRLEIKSPNLTIEQMMVGKQTNTKINLIYMRNICKQDIVARVRERLEGINIDKVEFLTDISTHIIKHKYTVFPQVQYTEKPDAVSASMLEGKVAIIVDGIPYAMVLPVVMNDFFQTPSDYGMNYIIASLFRILRYTLFFITLILPGFYVALTQFHMEMVPRSLAYSIAASKVGTPFPIAVEVILMILVFFTLIEAATRIPLSLAGTVSIVGGLVLGDAAISAKLVSPGVIVVVAFAAIASMAVPNKELNFALWIWMLVGVIVSAVLGLFGFAVCVIVLLYHLSKIEVLGVPYLAPFGGGKKMQLGDSIIRLPSFLLKYRPYHLQPKDKRKLP